MEIDVKVGLSSIVEMEVKGKDTAKNYGSGEVEVFATPAMIALMENTARGAIEGYLPKGYTTVGIAISTNHIKATAVGKKVKCEAVTEKVDGKKIEFKVTAWDETGKIGEGCHTRYIIDVEKFMSKLK